ncbi:hypothetical protein AA0614_1087 [Komagataeibacter saccharivorans NRIC 0614]|nr:hypothetical protein AA0614_1087 [Komagataeibacter saccharivorans NRIC 0614]
MNKMKWLCLSQEGLPVFTIHGFAGQYRIVSRNTKHPGSLYDPAVPGAIGRRDMGNAGCAQEGDSPTLTGKRNTQCRRQKPGWVSGMD